MSPLWWIVDWGEGHTSCEARRELVGLAAREARDGRSLTFGWAGPIECVTKALWMAIAAAEPSAAASITWCGRGGGRRTSPAAHTSGWLVAVCSVAKTGLVRSPGADHTIDYGIEDFTDG